MTTNGAVLLLDSASLYFRAFYGVPDRFRAPDGTRVNAVRGMLDIVSRLVETYSPSGIIACWDNDWRPQWRVELVPSYKAHRVVESGPDGDIEEVPDLLQAQLPAIVDCLTALHIPIVGADGYEADDVIGTLAAHATGPTDIVTGDRDLFQLVDDARAIRVISTIKGMSKLEEITDAVIVEKYGVHAAQYADFATLRGDASDGLPGVAGIGEKTAATMLSTHGTLAAVREAAERGEGMTRAQAAKVVAAADYLDVAGRVVAVAKDAPIPELDPTVPVPDAATRQAADEVAATWGVTSSMVRALDALSART